MSVTRREMLKGTGIVAAGLAMTGAAAAMGCAKSDDAADRATEGAAAPLGEVAWDREAEVLILGCGIAGACAAVEAYDLGAQVLVVDKAEDVINSSCYRSGGALAGCGSRIQKDHGIEDDVETLVDDFLKCGGDMADPDMIRAYAKVSGETVDWLVDLGCDVVDTVNSWPAIHSIDRVHRANPPESGLGWMQGLQDAIEERGIEVMFKSSADKLIQAEDGRVLGAQVTAEDGSVLNIKGTKGVLVATGGCGANEEAWKKYCPIMKEVYEAQPMIPTTGPKELNADSYRMIEEVGGYVYPIPPAYSGGCMFVNEQGDTIAPSVLPYRWAKEGIIDINNQGERFCDETSFPDFYDKKVWAKQPGKQWWLLLDSRLMATEDGQTYLQPKIDLGLENGLEPGADTFASADTLDELASILDIPADALKNTVEEFNALVGTIEPDEFGRIEFLHKVEEPPYWAIRMKINVGGSKGGCKINEDAQVLDVSLNPIPGLYAAGESAFFQFHGNASTHIPGACNSISATFGRIAARSMVAQEAVA